MNMPAISLDRAWGFVAVWEFQVRAGCEPEFERAYGSEGEWAVLFRSSPGFIATSLVRDPEKAGRYLTLDFWRDRQSYYDFRARHAGGYEEIDRRCEALTEREALIGAFQPVR